MALSYVWGPKEDQYNETVLINGRKVPIGKKLNEALHQLQVQLDQDAFSSQYKIWTDAICIDQSNASEKSDQVPKMARIYQSATTVVAYLGTEQDNCRLVFEECNGAGMRLFYSALLANLDYANGSRMYQQARDDRNFLDFFVRNEWLNVQKHAAAKTLGTSI
jgi:hypothetical protein